MRKMTLAAGLIACLVPVSGALADVTQSRDVDVFTEVEFDGLMEVNIRVGEEQSLTITANREKYLENVTTRVRNGVLRVDMDVEDGFFSIFRDLEVEVNITVEKLESVEMDGLGNLDISGVDSEDFYLLVDGMGSVSISGRCDSARLEIDGMGDLKARNFECKRVRLTLDGMGDAEIYASEYVDVLLDGFGDVEVYGDPAERDVREDGMGDVDFH